MRSGQWWQALFAPLARTSWRNLGRPVAHRSALGHHRGPWDRGLLRLHGRHRERLPAVAAAIRRPETAGGLVQGLGTRWTQKQVQVQMQPFQQQAAGLMQC